MEVLAGFLPARRGHFLLESGHHGDLWLDLELVFLRPGPIRELTSKLCRQVALHRPEIICGPLVEGAFVGLMVAQELDLPFAYSEPRATGDASGLFPVRYRIPEAQRSALREKRVAVVNDVVNAGSAVRGTLEALRAFSAEPMALATLAALGPAARGLAEENHLAFETLWELPNTIWTPDECPLCLRGVALSEGSAFK